MIRLLVTNVAKHANIPMAKVIMPKTLISRIAILLALIVTAFLGNYFKVELFYRVDFLFGSCVALVSLVLFGTWVGTLVAAIAASYTMVLWGHPYAALVWTLEVVWTGLLYRRLQQNLVLTVGLYWLFIGIPAIWFFYGHVMDVPTSSTNLTVLKQAINSIFNAFIANSLILFTPLRRLLDRRLSHKPHLTNIIYSIIIGTIFLPLLILVIFDGRNRVSTLEAQIKHDIDNAIRAVKIDLESWSKHHILAVKQLAELAAEENSPDPTKLQQAVKIVNETFPDFYTTYIADSQGTTIAFHPPANKNGESTIGLNFADRAYFKSLLGGQTLVLSDVFLARGGIFEPIIAINSSIIRDGVFKGFASGGLNLKRITDSLPEFILDPVMLITITDRRNTVIASNAPDTPTMLDYDPTKGYEIREDISSFYRRLPILPGKPEMVRWEKSTLGKRVEIPFLGWTTWIEMPLAPFQKSLQDHYITTLSIMFLLSMVGSVLAWFMARWIATPLADLSQWTTDLPKSMGDSPHLKWKPRGIYEIDHLGRNFSKMTQALNNYFGTIAETSSALLQANTQLKAEIEDRCKAEEVARVAQSTAEQANRAKSEFLANMSHEIRTPLGIMLGYTELMQLPSTRPAEAKEFLGIIDRNGRQLLELINDILNLSKVEAGKIDIEKTDVILGELIKSGIELFRSQAEDKGLELNILHQDPLPYWVSTDPLRLRQILINIVGNAIKFTSQGSVTITIGYTVENNNLKFEVRDTGIGITPDQAAKLFTMFMQADSSTTRKYGGTGLGLALAKQLAQHLGGDVILASSVYGQGSTFVATIAAGSIANKRLCPNLDNLFQESSSAPLHHRTSAEDKEKLRGKKVLIVDDDSSIRLIIRRILEQLGLQVLEGHNGEEAYEKALQEHPDLVLIDIQMPKMDGLTATRKLRGHGFQTPIIALTAHALAGEQEKSLAAGCNAHLTKPINRIALLEIVTTIIMERQQL